MRRAAAVLLSLCLAIAVHASDAVSEVPLGPLPRSVVPERYALELRLDADAEDFSGKVAIDVAVNDAVDTLWLHGRNLEIDSATLTTADGETLPLKASVAHAEAGVLKLVAPTTLAPGKARITLTYRAKYDLQLQGAYRVKVGDDAYVVTQMEPLGARNAFPAFDEPAFKTPWDVSLVVPDGQTAVANTAQIGIDKVQDGWKKLRFATTERLPTYLIAFAVGPWDIVEWQDIPPNAVRAEPLTLRGIAPKGRGAELRYALEHTAAQVAALEDFFALPYPFDKLDILAAPDFSFGAMENAGLIVYRESLLLGVDTAPTALRQAYWATHTHELSHQWFGNLVTMPWWDDLWLNESFASWMEARILRELKPEFHVERELLEGGLHAMTEDSLATARRIHEPVHDYTTVQSAFDGITYAKGAAVLSMFENYLGPQRFRDAIRLHMRKFARGSATSGDLMRTIAAHSDDASRVQQAFASFTDQPGVPMLRAQLHCKADRATLALTQTRYLPLGSTASADVRWGLPVCVRYAAGSGTRRQCTLLTEASGDMVLEADACPAWVHPNAEGAGYYRFALAAQDQKALAAAFASLDAGEQRVFADSLAAAWGSGLLSTDGFLAALPMLSKAQDRLVSVPRQGTLTWMRDHLPVDDAQRDAFDRWVVAIYRPRLDALGLDPAPGEDDERSLLRQDLINLLAPLPPARELRDALARRGRAVLGVDGDGALRPDAAPADQRGMALQLAAELGGVREFDAIERHLAATEDARLRRELLYALGSARMPALVERARAIALGDGLRAGETASIPLTQMEMPDLRDGTRTWMRTNFETLFAKMPAVWAPHLPGFEASGLCSAGDADALHAQYATRMKDVEGGALALAQAVEGIRLCAARLAHHRAAGFGAALNADS
ncbi:M1 family metallopeptidase [Chiayiivirga flava]|uniref:Aminopeptidase n=1 Tax=Chiayiivirga flava TaxID=659595 RepID=A0A7W8DB27_9GAMM|nr:M1 family metallopeptidase [Chiayiivirga flava]MBB5209448.1 alanyl aminopeptidase [Chiayiivirga flava]